MSSYSEKEDQFFDSRVEVSSVSDLGFDFSGGCSTPVLDNCALGYEFWTKNPESVDERRAKFFKWIGMSSDWCTTDRDDEENLHDEEIKMGIDRLRDNGETVLANLDSETQFFSSRSLQSFCSDGSTELVEDGIVDEDAWKIKNLDDGTEFVVDELSDHGTPTRLREVGSNKMLSLEEFQKTLGSSALVQRLLRKES
ncbi:Transducin/WD40 repeat-like superfamily protein [Forsythia ovata]|uniref:Transducin/WD40 repeat-like superfamily protein n=1 Tax=Forsythia ovata TaxID=205694 RepID=A0ABD1W5P8_9LAMI